MMPRVRFAPSPTGRLHLGNARGALINWLFARRHDGELLLRLDDTDADRSSAEYSRAIQEDLLWLGLVWDALARQSERMERYREAAETLKAKGRLYPCFETPEELERQRFRQVAGGGLQVYDRAALRLSEAQKRAYRQEGRSPHWRFLLDYAEIGWQDTIRGPVRYHGARLSDPVLVRADGTPIYTLASVVDDFEFEITHIIRGEDHVTNTAVQLQIFAALGRDPASLTFAHFSLLTDQGGHNLSKRLGSLSVAALREEGIEPMAISSLLARLGTSDAIEAKPRLADLVAEFDLAKFSRASPKLDVDELKRLSARLVHDLPFAAVAERLAVMGLGQVDAAFWFAVRPNVSTLHDVRDWWQVAHGDVRPVISDPAFADTARRLLPEGRWDAATWEVWTRAVAAATGRKGRELYQPLRLALTAREHGPELKTLLPMIGRERAWARLAGKIA
ncbi:MAG: glutamate--tRNA ligase [Pseudomonadota bacterium]